jgi:peptidoglycan hydrolase-like protein with peptidoglycan-binding domain
MNFQSIVSLALTLLGKREELVSVVKDVIAVWNKIKGLAPDVVDKLEAVAGGETKGSEYSIEWLQQSLNKLIDAKLTVDGNYGKATQDAVKKFQAANGLTADGWAGVQTQAKIVDALG